MMIRIIAWAIAVTAVLSAGPAVGQALRIGVAVETTSIDPYYAASGSNVSVLRNVFEPLVRMDRRMRPAPGLALSWAPVSDTVWELRLRPDVMFHDGTAMTASDVAFSLARPDKLAGAVGGFKAYTREIAEVTEVGPLTLRIRTREPWPLLPVDLSTIVVVPRTIAGHDGTAAFNDGTAAIGTGPFRFVSWLKGQSIALRRYDGYHGRRPDWADVEIRPVPNDSARVAALLARDVDLIEAVPTSLVARLAGEPGIAIARTATSRLIFLQVDTARDVSPFVVDGDGRPLAHNPLRDPRVRRAISKAIDRPGLVAHIMDGTGAPAGQLLPDGSFGVSSNLPPEPFDPDGARNLLAAAGWPDGFTMTLQGPNNRYVNDRALGEAVARMLNRAGIHALFDPMPGGVISARAEAFALSAYLWGWASETGEPSGPLRSMVATRDAGLGWGSSNRFRYSNPDLDRMLRSAMTTLDDGGRETMLREATEIAVRDGGVIPILFEDAIWAMRADLRYETNPLGYTLAADVTAIDGH